MKYISKTVRFPEDVVVYLDRQPGKTFTEKLLRILDAERKSGYLAQISRRDLGTVAVDLDTALKQIGKVLDILDDAQLNVGISLDALKEFQKKAAAYTYARADPEKIREPIRDPEELPFS